MPTKRQVLDQLSRDELLALADARQIIPGDRRIKGHIADLLEARAPAVPELLAGLSRERLKELCRALGLDDGGREKAVLLARLGPPQAEAPAARAAVVHRRAAPVAAKGGARTHQLAFADASFALPRPVAPPRPVSAPPPAKKESAPPRPVSTPPPAKKESAPPPASQPALTQSELESHLWEAANILRGSPVDRTDWKSYILPLLFFKRICDVWDEEHEEMVRDYGDDYADQHRFQIPKDRHWQAVRAKTADVGASIQRAMREIEAANPKHLHGVFGDAQWSNKERLPDDLLKDLIEHFSALSLRNARVTSDAMGDAYEYLIKKFADATNKKAGEFYTPRSVVRLMADMLDPKPGETIYDPACGTGGMLLAAVAHARDQGADARTLFGKLYGQEKNLTTEAVARMNLFLHNIEDFHIQRGDTLRSPTFTDSAGALATFDVVLANPPFSLEQWGREVWESDPWGRNFAGVPTDSSGDFAWVQHMVKSMADKTGRMAVVLPLGALFHSGIEATIRKKLVDDDLLESIVALGPNLFYETGIPTCIMVCRRTKPAQLRKHVLFLDVSDLYLEGRSQNELTPDHTSATLNWYARREDVDGRARIVSRAELAENGYSLFPALYVWNDNALRYASKGAAQSPLSPREAHDRLLAAIQHARDAEAELRVLMQEVLCR